MNLILNIHLSYRRDWSVVLLQFRLHSTDDLNPFQHLSAQVPSLLAASGPACLLFSFNLN